MSLDRFGQADEYFLSVGLIAYAWIMPLHLAQMNQLKTNSGEI